MADMSLERVLQAAQSLTPEEQRQLRARLDEGFKKPAGNGDLQAFHQALISSGLVTTIKPRQAAAARQPLIKVKGKPLSETIVEERR